MADASACFPAAPIAESVAAAKRNPRKKRLLDAATEARDKWIYNQCCKGVAYETIAIRLKKKSSKWQRIESKQGIQSAAQRYAKRHGLEEIPRRQDAE